MKSPSSVRAEFDAKAAGYENGRLARWYREQNRLVLARMRFQSGGSVLDVGCGTGWLLRQTARRFSGITGLGIDLSPSMIAVARERTRVEAIPGLKFVAGDWLEIEPGLLLQANRLDDVDVVCCVSAFHYFSEPEVALEKMRQVLRPGGRLLLLDRARDGSPLTFAWDLVHRAILRDTVKFYRSDELCELVGRAGFDDVRAARRVRKLFWKGKLATSLVLVEARKP